MERDIVIATDTIIKEMDKGHPREKLRIKIAKILEDVKYGSRRCYDWGESRCPTCKELLEKCSC